MKALMSERAKLLLADPKARDALVDFLLSNKASRGAPSAEAPVISVSVEGKPDEAFSVRPEIVSKAA